MIGLGDPLLADIGVRRKVVGLLNRSDDCGPAVELEDRGTLGMNPLPLLEQAERGLCVDANRTGAAPGSVELVPTGIDVRFR